MNGLTNDVIIAVGKAILPYLPSEISAEALGALSYDAAVAVRRKQALVVPPDLVEASRRASRGDGFTSGAPWFHDEDLLLTLSPDGNTGHVVADFDLAGCRAEDIPSEDGCGLSEAKDDARFAAMCWTFVRRLIAEQDTRERLL